MRTIIDIPDDVVSSLDEIGTTENRSRAALIREAIGIYLQQKTLPPPQTAFGLWRSDPHDSIDYQTNLRSEWDNR